MDQQPQPEVAYRAALSRRTLDCNSPTRSRAVPLQYVYRLGVRARVDGICKWPTRIDADPRTGRDGDAFDIGPTHARAHAYLPATASASAAATAPRPPPDPNASATREDYDEAQAAKKAAEQAAVKAAEPAKPKKKTTMARKSALLSTPEQVSTALAEQPNPPSGPVKLRIKPLERPTPSTAEQSPARATRAQIAAATPTTPATPVEMPKSPTPPAERTPRSSQTPPRLEIAQPGEAPASAPLRTSPRVTPRVTPQNK